jgi:uncharacterized protein (DUF2141 family)
MHFANKSTSSETDLREQYTMKRLATAAAVLLATTAFAAAQAGEIDLTLNGVQPKGGKILVTVQSRDQFMQRAQTSGAVLDGAASGQLKVTLPDVPPGDYAVSVLHDADSSWSMTDGADGKPAEGWAMSSAAPLRAKPTFDQVKVSVNGDASVTETMFYPK